MKKPSIKFLNSNLKDERREVIIEYSYNGKKRRRSYFVDVNEKYDKNDYFKIAQENFKKDVASNKLRLINRRPYIIGAVCVLSLGIIGGSLGIYFANTLQPDITIELNANGGLWGDKNKIDIKAKKGNNLLLSLFDVPKPVKEGMAFDYWTINGEKVPENYIISKNVKLDAVYFTPIQPNEISDNGIVLLENKNKALPLKDEEKRKQINIFGFGGSKKGWFYQGNGSGVGNTDNRICPFDALKQSGYNVNENLENAYNNLDISNNVGVSESPELNYTIRETGLEFINEQLENNVENDSIGLYVVSRYGGEGNDLPKFQNKVIQNKKGETIPGWDCDGTLDKTRKYLELSTEEEANIKAIATNSKISKLIVILNTCGPMECGFLKKPEFGVDAAFYMPVAGNKGTLTIPKVLDGTVNPSGHLTDTFAYKLETAPSYYNVGYFANESATHTEDDNYFSKRYEHMQFNDHKNDYIHYTTYQENIYIGYYWYETADKEHYWDEYGGYDKVVQYPFGYGQSYTTFSWECNGPKPKYSALMNLRNDDELKFDIKVTNTGNVSGKDVVELYVEKPYTKGGIEKPAVQLIGFAKTKELSPGESETVVINTRIADFADYDAYDKNNDGHIGYELDCGDYNFSLRTDSHHLKGNEFSYKAHIGMSGITENYHYNKDMDTGHEIRNRFTNFKNGNVESVNDDKHPVNGICASIDGTDFTNQPIELSQYLTRANFKDTMPKEFLSFKGDMGDFYEKTWKVNDPWMEDDKAAPPEDIESPVTLFDVCNKPYDDPIWDKLMDKLTFIEMKELVRDGGFKTIAIKKINKKETIDRDGPCGFASAVGGAQATPTNFPSDTMVASTWDIKISHAFGKALGYEAINKLGGINGNYGPGLNIHRSPLGGRNFEYYSEDPLLSGNICSWQISGAKEEGMYCYAKHLALNDSDLGRNGRYNFATEQAFRQIYAKPFEIITKGAKAYDASGNVFQALKANAMMASVDRIGSTRVTGSYNFLTEVVRNEWGFRGTIITDYYQAGNVNDIDEGIRAGNNLMLNGGDNCQYDDQSSNTFKYYVREAAKGILYTYINTKYEALVH